MLASRATRVVSLGFAGVCAAALLAACPSRAAPAGIGATSPANVDPAPVASDARLAGDDKQTRFILDLDKKVDLRAFTLANPDRVVVDIPQVSFRLPAGTGGSGRGLIKAFRYGMVMPGASRMVFDLTGPAKIDKAYVLDGANGQPPRLILELAAVDRTAFMQSVPAATRPELKPSIDAPRAVADATGSTSAAGATPDARPLVVIDPGHGGIDNGTQAASGEAEKTIVLEFAQALHDRLEKDGKYRVVMTRNDDTFIPLDDRVKIARNDKASLFVSIHADSLPHREGDAQGATIYTLSDKASDAEAAHLAESENRADAIGGVNLTEEPSEVADILIDLAQRETRAFSNRFARLLMREMKGATRMHKNPLKSAGFRVLKAPDVPSVLIELGYVSNKSDLHELTSDNWRKRTVKSVAEAIDTFLAKRVVSATPAD